MIALILPITATMGPFFAAGGHPPPPPTTSSPPACPVECIRVERYGPS
jgi:hypothetical protein